MPTSTNPFIGRWDLTLHHPSGDLPMWLEIRLSGFHTFVGAFVGTHGSARPIARIDLDGERFAFAIPPQWESGDGDLRMTGELRSDQLAGTATLPDGQSLPWDGKRAPLLRHSAPNAWTEPFRLFNGTDLNGWHVAGGPNHWIVQDGILRNLERGGNLITDAKFEDFQLHVEFRLPEGGNSGVYLRGRYEIQVLDDPRTEPASDLIGGIYGFLPPSEIVTSGVGTWTVFDVTLVGRIVTLAVNGKIVISNQAIPGITGGALDSEEGAPGPIYLQGDHTAIEYRNLIIAVPR